MTLDPYQILKVNPNAKLEEIKRSYRQLVKLHHPDKGGDIKKMLEINEAWGMLKKRHKNLDKYKIKYSNSYRKDNYKQENNKYSKSEDIRKWFKTIYIPIDKLLGQIINPLTSKIKDLSADPYDELLMDSFCLYIEKSKNKMERIKKIYASIPSPSIAK